jgi:acyl carrier protein
MGEKVRSALRRLKRRPVVISAQQNQSFIIEGEKAMSSVRDDVIEIIVQASKPRSPDLSDDSIPLLKLGLDSLDYATAIMEIESKYRIEIAEKDMERLGSLKDIVTFIEAKLKKP